MARTAGRERQRQLTLDQLHAFVVVAQREHVTAAAAAMGISQGSVSTLVRRLEAALGLPLFQRVGRNIRLSDVGRALLPLATRVLEDLHRIEEMRSGFAAVERGELTLASGRVIGAHRLSGWLAPFIAEHPEINVHITLASIQHLVELLVGGDVDVIVAGSPVAAPGLETLAMERTEMVLVVASAHALARSAAPLRELGSHRQLVHERGTATELRAAELLGGMADQAETVELEEGALLAALLAGLGFAAMPRAVVEPEVAAGRLVALPRPGRRVAQVFTAARRRGPQSPALEAFWEHLRRIAAA